ncbi:MAG: RNA-binding protein [Planctomycetes bacterium]|nr:RNA-binding protein [Planctomycetota bacterium]
MPKELYVSGLPLALDENGLTEMFKAYGEVVAARIIRDKISKEPRGFGFVEMATDEMATAAINELNGKALEDKTLIVSESKGKKSKPHYGGGGFGFGGGGGDRHDRGRSRFGGGGRGGGGRGRY